VIMMEFTLSWLQAGRAHKVTKERRSEYGGVISSITESFIYIYKDKRR
jgi:hypothetical protein